MADTKKVIEVVVKGRNELSTVIKAVSKDLTSMTNIAKNVGIGMVGAGVAIGTALGVAVTHTAAFGEELVKLRGRTGLTAETLSELKFVADQSETSLDGLANGFRFLAKNAYEASKGGNETADAFKALGVDVTDASGKLRPLKDLFVDAAEGLRGVTNDAERTALTLKIFGRGGTELANVLKLTKDQFASLTAEAHRLGLTMDDDAADAADAFGDSVDATKASIDGLVRTIAGQAIPRLTEYINKIQEVAVAANRWAKENPQTGGTIVSLTETLIGAGGLVAALAILGQVLGFVTGGLSKLAPILKPLASVVTLLLAAFTAPEWAAIAAGVAIIGSSFYAVKGILENLKTPAQKAREEIEKLMAAPSFNIGAFNTLGLAMALSMRGLVDEGKKAPPVLASIDEQMKALQETIDKLSAPKKLADLIEQLRLLKRTAQEAFVEDFETGDRPRATLKSGPAEQRRSVIAGRPEGEDLLGLDLVDPWLEQSTKEIGEFAQIGVDAVSSVGNALGSALSAAINGTQQQFTSLGDFLKQMFAEVAASAASAFAKLGIGSILGTIFPGAGIIAKLFPKFEHGGFVPKTGPAIVHAGEAIIPKADVDHARSQSRGERSQANRGGSNGQMNQNVTINMGLMFGSRVETLEAARRIKNALDELNLGFAR